MIVDLLRNDLVRHPATCCNAAHVTSRWRPQLHLMHTVNLETAGPGLRAGVRACAGPDGAGVLCHCAPAGQHRAWPEARGESASLLLLGSDPGAVLWSLKQRI